MPSPAQIDANRANALLSTGPKTPEGRARAAANRTSNGLRATRESIFQTNSIEQSNYEDLHIRLELEVLPAGTAEQAIFEQYAFSTFQALRAQRFEIQTQSRWEQSPDDHTLFVQMERTAKLGAMYERRAAKALAELRKLQADRLAAAELAIQTPICFPIAALTKSKVDPEILACQISLAVEKAIEKTVQNPIEKPLDNSNPIRYDGPRP